MKGKSSRATVRETHRATESIQKKKGLVDKRVSKIVKEWRAKDILNVEW